MKRITQLTIVVALAVSPLWAQETPAGTAGGEQQQLRPLSHKLAPTHVTVVWSACGTAKIDGILSPGEWASATTHTITVNTAAGAVPATLYVMSDNLTLYMALKFPEPAPNYGSLGVEFDNNNNGVPFEPGDDAIVHNNQFGLFDDFRTATSAPSDTSAGGTSEGRGAYHNDGTNSVYEIAHPFNTLDLGHDLAICGGHSRSSGLCQNTVGFFILLRQISGGALHDTYYPDIAVYDQIQFLDCAPPLLSACGTPTLDGEITPGEWAPSGQYRLSVNTTANGETTPGTFYLMNDTFNLYSALAFDETALTPNQQLYMGLFLSGSTLVWQDLLTFDSNTGFEDSWVKQPSLCFHIYCAATDLSSGAKRDGRGALANDGASTAYELGHPLNSGETFDVALALGDTIPYVVSLNLASLGTTVGFFSNWKMCTPGPTQNVRDLSQQVDALGTSGALSSKNADTLRKDLIKADGNLQSGKLKQAANDLGNFVNDVTKMMRKGELADQFGQPLVAAANSAMSQL